MHNKGGWSFLFDDNTPVVNFKDELKYNFRRWLIDLLSIVPFLITLIVLFIYSKILKKNKKNKILLGTVPIISFELLSKVLTRHKIDNTLFVFQDWSDGNFHTGISFKDICSLSFINKSPYGFGPYIAFLWALKNFDIYCLYFDSGFLERTIFWKIEPILYQIFDKKVLMIPYGNDVWSTKQNKNRIHKMGHIVSMKKYFFLDKKREDRIFHWSKYVNLIIASSNYIDYLQRIDILVYHGHIIDNIDNYSYCFKKDRKIKLMHYANDSFRKGSAYIESTLKVSNYDIELEFCYALPRKILFSKLDNSHFYIEQVVDGFFSYSTFEALLKGKIVFTYLDESLNETYKIINSDYYIDFFENSPIVNINSKNMQSKIQEYLNKDFEELKEISLNSREFAKKLLLENEKMYVDIFNKLKS